MTLSTLLRPACVLLAALMFAVFSGNVSVAADGPEGGTSTEPATLGELIDIGLRENPGIKARRLAWKSTVERYPQARSLEDPVLTYTQPIQEIETRLGPNKRSIMLSQGLPFPGSLRVKGKIAVKDAEIAQVALERAERDLVLKIKKAYYDLYYLDTAIRLAGERTRVLEHFSDAERNNYSVGIADFSEIVSAETRLADAGYDLIQLTELRRAAVSTLNTLLNRDPEEPIDAVAEPELGRDDSTLEELYDMAAGNEDVRAAGLRVEKSVLGERLSAYTSRPRFMVGVNYTEIGEPATSGLADGGRDAVAVTLGMTIPIWTGRNNASRREATLQRTGSEQEKLALINTLGASVKSAYVDMSSNYRHVKLYSDTLIPKAEKLVETAQVMYKNGNGSIADIFEAKVMLINFNLAYHRAASNYLKSLAELERLTSGYALKEGDSYE